MVIAEVFKRLVKRGQQSSTMSASRSDSTRTSTNSDSPSWIKPTESLAAIASRELQLYDEWVSEMEDGRSIDFGDALERIEGLKALAEKVLDEEVEL